MVPRRRRTDPVQVETLTPPHQQARRVCTAGSVSALASNPHMIGADPAGLARFAVCCTLIYLIIIGCYPALYSVRRGGGIWIDGSAAFDGMPSNVSQAVHSGLCGCCIVCAGMGQINGNAPVKPCALFCSVCDNNLAWTAQNAL